MKKERFRERLGDYENALGRLIESLDLELTNSVIMDGAIQRFEFTFELAWKTMKNLLELEGFTEIKSPRGAIKEAFSYGLINDGDSWIDMMMDRNKTSHLYDEGEAKLIYEKIKNNHMKLLKNLLEVMKTYNIQ